MWGCFPPLILRSILPQLSLKHFTFCFLQTFTQTNLQYLSSFHQVQAPHSCDRYGPICMWPFSLSPRFFYEFTLHIKRGSFLSLCISIALGVAATSLPELRGRLLVFCFCACRLCDAKRHWNRAAIVCIYRACLNCLAAPCGERGMHKWMNSGFLLHSFT